MSDILLADILRMAAYFSAGLLVLLLLFLLSYLALTLTTNKRRLPKLGKKAEVASAPSLPPPLAQLHKGFVWYRPGAELPSLYSTARDFAMRVEDGIYVGKHYDIHVLDGQVIGICDPSRYRATTATLDEKTPFVRIYPNKGRKEDECMTIIAEPPWTKK